MKFGHDGKSAIFERGQITFQQGDDIIVIELLGLTRVDVSVESESVPFGGIFEDTAPYQTCEININCGKMAVHVIKDKSSLPLLGKQKTN